MNRWPLFLFAALVILPFALVWSLTEGRQIVSSFLPVYEITAIGKVVRNGNDLDLHDITIYKSRECSGDGVVMASIPYVRNGQTHEVLAQVEIDGTGKPVFLTPKYQAGDQIQIEHWRVRATEEILAQATSIRFVMPCRLTVLGLILSYTNVVYIS